MVDEATRPAAATRRITPSEASGGFEQGAISEHAPKRRAVPEAEGRVGLRDEREERYAKLCRAGAKGRSAPWICLPRKEKGPLR